MNIAETSRPRSAEVAGAFYPADPDLLAFEVDQVLEHVNRPENAFQSVPRAVISPHAGYRFSGMLTAAAISSLKRSNAKSVVVLSPSHRHRFQGIALPSAAAFRLPGMNIEIDIEARQSLLQAGLAHIEDAAHENEHGIETQLPFLNRVLPEARVVPLVIGDANPRLVARIVDYLALLRGSAPVFVLSSDLSHFQTLKAANDFDAETARLIETGGWQKLTAEHACGHRAITGFIASHFAQSSKFSRIAMANSSSTSGDDNRTVGYGAWAIFGQDDEVLNRSYRTALLECAHQALVSSVRKAGQPPNVDTQSFPFALRGYGASFVTLNIGGRLRGCIGSLAPHRPLIEDVVINTAKAAFQDARFKPVRADEVSEITIKIAVLSPSSRLSFSNQHDLEAQLRPGQDGLIIQDGNHRGTFLPMVWDHFSTAHDYVQALKVKAGLPKDHWSDTFEAARFSAESFAAPVANTTA